MSAPATPPIIVIKRKGGHAGHHGGAWKVAYADFVTAMMALFIVLWLLSSSEDVRKSVAGYFRDPKGFGKEMGSSMGGTGQSMTLSKATMDQLKDKLQQAIKKSPQFEKMKDYVEMTITGEGLRIELLENDKGMFFETGQPVPTVTGSALLIKLAHELGSMRNSILVEGHTDAAPYQGEHYSNWELSADRANAARKIMQENGLRPDQVTQVRGFADQQLRDPTKPDAPSNRRVSIIVQFPQTPDPEPAPVKGGKEEGGGDHGPRKATDKKTSSAVEPSEAQRPTPTPPQSPSGALKVAAAKPLQEPAVKK
jgi:chemotaxis protein MotB